MALEFGKGVTYFRKMISDGVSFLVTEAALDDPEESKKRESVCHSNANTCYDKKNDECRLCSCGIRNKVKALKNKNVKKLRVEVTHCPLGLWDDKATANYYRQMDGKRLLK